MSGGRLRQALAPAVAAAGGAAFFLSIFGLRVVDPTATTWLMLLDWRIHFLDWQFFRREPSLPSPLWPRVLLHYRHIVAYPASYCGPPPVDVESLAWLAGANGVGLNSGLVARFNEDDRMSACRALDETLVRRGAVDDTRLYVGRPEVIVLLKRFAKQPVVCGVIDGLGLCATARSYEAWRDVLHLE